MSSNLKEKASHKSIECWDDDEDFADIYKVSNTKIVGHARRAFRESSSSRVSLSSGSFSLNSETEFNDDIPPDTASPVYSFVHTASNISFPDSIPPTAFVGGSIKKLSSHNRQSSDPGDWGDDIDLPTGTPLKLKNLQAQRFPNSLSDHSSAEDSPGGFDKEDEDDIPTIRMPKKLTPKPTIVGAFDEPSGTVTQVLHGFEPTSNGLQQNESRMLPHSTTVGPKRPVTPPAMDMNDSDIDGSGEGSIGTRHAGRHRHRNSSVSSILSPSVSSSFTFDSDDDNFGLELPETNFNFKDALEQKRRSRTDEAMADLISKSAVKDEFLEGLEFGDKDLFGASSNKNVKHKLIKPPLPSPSKRNAMTLTFSQKHSQLQTTRAGRRLSGVQLHTLEPVAEVLAKSSDPRAFKKEVSPSRSSRNLKGLADTQKLATLIPIRTKESLGPPVKSLGPSDKQKSLRSQKSTPNLKSQGSSPIKLRQPLPPPMPMRIPRPSSRASINSDHSDSPGQSLLHSLTFKQHPLSGLNPRRPSSRQEQLPTQLPRPTSRASKGRPASRNSQRSPSNDRQSMCSRASNQRPPSRPSSRLSAHSKNEDRSRSPGRPRTPHDSSIPLPTGSSLQQPQYALSKSSRPIPHKQSATQLSYDNTKRQILHKKKSSITRPPNVIAPEFLRDEAASIKTLRTPARRRNFGTGHELENFDDLPTVSKSNLRVPEIKTDGVLNPVLKSRRQSIVNGQPGGRSRSGSLKAYDNSTSSASLRDKRIPDVSRNIVYNDVRRSPKKPTLSLPNQKPRLIKGSDPMVAKAAQDMKYNPKTMRWEGNENEPDPFEDNGNLPTNLPRPALIASIKSAKNVQVVGKMVFDPTHMCWLKVDNTASDEEDVFGGIDDLDDGTSATPESIMNSGPSEKFQDAPLAEEFDLGPVFKKRQYEEEERWRDKVKGWINTAEASNTSRAWDLRQIAISDYNQV